MHIRKSLILFFSCGLLLAGCGQKTASNPEVSSNDTTAELATSVGLEKETSVESEDTSDTEVSESELGKITRLAVKKNLDQTLESGPFKITVEAIQKAQLQPSEDYIEIMGGDDLAVVAVQVLVEHESEDTNAIYPDQSTIVTNTKKQIDADLFLSDSVGGDFIGPVNKDGEVFFIFDDKAEEITSFKYIVGSAHDENYDNFGEDLIFEFEF